MTHVTILTGASRGIGKAIAEIILARDSTKLIAVARNEQDLKQLVSEHGEDRVAYVCGDIAKESVSADAVKTAISKFGRIDSIIANAGVIAPVGKIDETKVEDWKVAFDINYFSIVYLIQHSLAELKKTKGNVVVVSSGASNSAYSGWYAYGGTKAAVNHLVLQLASDEPEVSAVAIAPGVVRTAMQEEIREVHGSSMSEAHSQKFKDLHSNDELLAPEVPAAVLANLALDGFDKSINGKYLRHNDPLLASYKLSN